MRKTMLALVAASTVAVAMPAAAGAQVWQPINQRQQNLDRRIDQGIRNGALTRREAQNLRAEFRDIVRIEAQYRRSNGLQPRERVDLQRRFDRLSARVWVNKNDRQNRPYR